MSALFDALPGISIPVHTISRSLAHMWQERLDAGGTAPAADATKATQVNFVLHFGMKTEPEDARRQFDTTVEFSQRYPSRVVVLCPEEVTGTGEGMRAKIYGECFLGKSKGDTRCVEFVILNYPMAARRFLEDLVSICLSTDLPLYYWAHRFSSTARLGNYQYLLKTAKRVVLDSAIVPADSRTCAWPQPEAVRDLVYARLLPVRQGLGQFLSGIAPARLVNGLRTVRVTHAAVQAAEARVLADWFKERLAHCGDVGAVEFVLAAGGADDLAACFDYVEAGTRFRWHGDLGRNHAEFVAEFGERVTLTTGMRLLRPAAALSEAVFF